MAIDIGRLAVRLFDVDLHSHPEAEEDRALLAEYAVGSGILVAPDLVLTCAHVINAAFHQANQCSIPPDDSIGIQLDFPATDKNPGIQMATVIRDSWYPPSNSVNTQQLEDAVLLKLDSLVDDVFDEQLKLCKWGDPDYENKSIKTLGYSNGIGDRIDGESLGFTDGWIQLKAERPIIEGCSGGPVTDKQTGELIGMLVAAVEEENIAYLIPAYRFEKILPSSLFSNSLPKKHSSLSPVARLEKQLVSILGMCIK